MARASAILAVWYPTWLLGPGDGVSRRAVVLFVVAFGLGCVTAARMFRRR